jgi:hypothetical protein
MARADVVVDGRDPVERSARAIIDRLPPAG